MRGAAAALFGVLAVSLAACGGSGSADRAGAGTAASKELYQAYRTTEDERTDAESRLRRAFSDIAGAAERRDRVSTLAAVERGRSAARDIDRLLERELEAARGLGAFEAVQEGAGRLEAGLDQTRRGLALFVRQLEIAALDPFLDSEENALQVNRLAREAANLSVEGEFAIRRADRAIALALGIEPRLDPLLDAPAATGP